MRPARWRHRPGSRREPKAFEPRHGRGRHCAPAHADAQAQALALGCLTDAEAPPWCIPNGPSPKPEGTASCAPHTDTDVPRTPCLWCTLGHAFVSSHPVRWGPGTGVGRSGAPLLLCTVTGSSRARVPCAEPIRAERSPPSRRRSGSRFGRQRAAAVGVARGRAAVVAPPSAWWRCRALWNDDLTLTHTDPRLCCHGCHAGLGGRRDFPCLGSQQRHSRHPGHPGHPGHQLRSPAPALWASGTLG